jgi:hypothetical protein
MAGWGGVARGPGQVGFQEGTWQMWPEARDRVHQATSRAHAKAGLPAPHPRLAPPSQGSLSVFLPHPGGSHQLWGEVPEQVPQSVSSPRALAERWADGHFQARKLSSHQREAFGSRPGVCMHVCVCTVVFV